MVTIFNERHQDHQHFRMIPLRDTVRLRTVPYINYLLIGACGVVFAVELSLGSRAQSLFYTFGVVPGSIVAAYHDGTHSVRAYVPLFTSMFLHGGWLHLIGNMLYLYIFGDNVEDRLGHLGYLMFYLLSGVGAAVTQIYFQPDSTAPLIGASGAIAGVLGAYFLLYPRARVLTIIPLFLFFPVVELSAFFFLGFWFVMQFLQATLTTTTDASDGVAWWAHAGGFIVGAVLLPVFLLVRRK
jgi:membrane associated rhomboid family serine protease